MCNTKSVNILAYANLLKIDFSQNDYQYSYSNNSNTVVSRFYLSKNTGYGFLTEIDL